MSAPFDELTRLLLAMNDAAVVVASQEFDTEEWEDANVDLDLAESALIAYHRARLEAVAHR